MFNKTKNILLSFVLLMLVTTTQFNVNAVQKKTVYVTIEKSTLGQGFILEPIKLEVDKDANADAIITNLLNQKKIGFEANGKVGDSFYIYNIKNADNGVVNVPKEIKNMPAYTYVFDGKNDAKPDLPAFAYSASSGWMYTVNNVMAPEGMSTYKINDNAVIRLQFTLVGYGSDLGQDNKNPDAPVLKLADKSNLIKLVANVSDYKDACFKDNECKKAFNNAIIELANHTNTQTKIDNAFNVLNNKKFSKENLVDKPKVDHVKSLINKIPSKVSLKDKTTVNNAKQAYDALNTTQKSRVDKSLVIKLNNALTTIKNLQNAAKPLPKNKTFKKGNTTYYQYLIGKRYVTNKTVYKKGSTTTTTYYIMVKGKNKVTKKQTYVKYKKKNVRTYYNYIKYYSNGKVKQNEKQYKDKKTNKYTKKNKTVYRSNGKKSKYIAFAYKKGKATKRTEYVYNKLGKTRSDKHGKAYCYITKYNKKGKAIRTDRKQYSKKGKLQKNKKVGKRTSF